MGSLARASLILRQPPACGPPPPGQPYELYDPEEPTDRTPPSFGEFGSTTAIRASARPGGGAKESRQCCPAASRMS